MLGAEALLEGGGVRERPQVAHVDLVGRGEVEPARPGARGEQEPAEGRGALLGVHGEPLEVDARDRFTQTEVDVVLGVPLRRLDVRRLATLLALEVALRQGRALVGNLGLLGEDHDLVVVPGLAELHHGSTRCHR